MFVSHRARMSGEFDSRKDLHSSRFEQRPQLSFRGLRDSILFGLGSFDNTAISMS